MRKLLTIFLLFISIAALAQTTPTTPPPGSPQLMSTNTVYQDAVTKKYYVYNGSTFLWRQLTDSLEVKRMIEAAAGGVTSITPGIGFLSHTPITTIGTMNVDTGSVIQTIPNLYPRGDLRWLRKADSAHYIPTWQFYHGNNTIGGMWEFNKITANSIIIDPTAFGGILIRNDSIKTVTPGTGIFISPQQYLSLSPRDGTIVTGNMFEKDSRWALNSGDAHFAVNPADGSGGIYISNTGANAQLSFGGDGTKTPVTLTYGNVYPTTADGYLYIRGGSYGTTSLGHVISSNDLSRDSTYNAATYLPLRGGTMTGDINMQNNKIQYGTSSPWYSNYDTVLKGFSISHAGYPNFVFKNDTLAKYSGGVYVDKAVFTTDLLTAPVSTAQRSAIDSTGRAEYITYPDSMTFRPFAIYRDQGGVYHPNATAISVKNELIKKGTSYYISTSGSDSNSGLTPLLPKKTVSSVMTANLGKTSIVYIAPGIYRKDVFDVTKAASDSSNLVLIGAGTGKTYLTGGNSAAETWTATAGGAYTASIAGVTRALDAKYLNVYGLLSELKYVSTADSTQIVAGSVFYNSTDVYVHTQDGRMPDANVLVLKNEGNEYIANKGTFYAEGISFTGSKRALQIFSNPSTSASQVHAYLYNCNFTYGSIGEGLWTFNIASTWSENCLSAFNSSDGFNYKSTNNPIAQGVVEINNQSFNNGFYQNKPKTPYIYNASSAHSSIDVVRVNCIGFGNAGPNYIDVSALSTDSTYGKKQYILNAGVTAYSSAGRYSSSDPNSGNADFQGGSIGGRTIVYCYGCVSRSDSSFKAQSGSTIYRDSFTRYAGTSIGNVISGTAPGTAGLVSPSISYPQTNTFADMYSSYTNGPGINLTGNVFSLDKTYTDTYYPQLTGSYSNPAWITSLSATKLTGAASITSLLTTSTIRAGGGASPTLPSLGASSAFTPLVGSSVSSGQSGIYAYVPDGTNNRRIGLVVNQTDGVVGISMNQSTGVAPFVITNGSTEWGRFDASGNFGIGTGATVSARLHAISTTEQLRVGYSATQYWNAVTNSTGGTIFTPTGTTPYLALGGTIKLNSISSGTAGTDSLLTKNPTTNVLGKISSSFYVPSTRTVAGFALSSNITLASLTPGYGLTGSAYNGSTAQALTADTTSGTGLVSKSRLATNLGGYRKTSDSTTLFNQFLSTDRSFSGNITAKKFLSGFQISGHNRSYIDSGSMFTVSANNNIIQLYSGNGSNPYLDYNIGGFHGQLKSDNITAGRTWQLPDAGGILAINNVLYTNSTTKTVTNTTTETSLIPTGVGSLTLPIGVAGKEFRSVMGGVYSAPAVTAGTLTVNVYYGSTLLATGSASGLLAGASNLSFNGNLKITTITVGASGTVTIDGAINYSVGNNLARLTLDLNNTGNTVTVANNATQTFDVRVQWDTASTSKIIKATQFSLESLN